MSISKEYQQVMALAGQDDGSIEPRLAKGDVAPSPVATSPGASKVSALTRETRESKAKAKSHTAEESKNLATQYIDTFSTLHTKLETNDTQLSDLQKLLGLAMITLEKITEKWIFRMGQTRSCHTQRRRLNVWDPQEIVQDNPA